MSGAEIGLALSVFLACAVEAVEALTIVLAVGSTRSWSSSFYGVGAATVVLAVLVAALGIAAAVARSGIAAWWVMPIAVPLLLASLWRVARDARQ